MGALDLYSDETSDRLSNLAPVKSIEAGAFDGFVKGAVYSTMRGFAKTARAIDLLGAMPAILEDKVKAFETGQTATGITEAQDKYFREHDEVFGNAVEAWTLKPGEVGIAGEVVGGLISTLPMVITSPALTVATAQLSASEDLVRKGVSPEKAGAVGAVEGAGLGLGIWMPILGTNGWQRIVLGGAGFNVLQGVATRGVSGAILEGEKAGEDYKAFDSKALTLDVLLGAAFGTLAHLSPSQRAQGAEVWKRIEGWAKELPPSQVDAIAALRQAQHLNVDSAPGTPEGLTDIDKHVTAMRTAIDDVLAGRPVNVDGIMDGVKFLPDAERNAFREDAANYLSEQALKILNDEVLTHEQRLKAQDVPGFLRTAEDLIALRGDKATLNPELERAVEIAKKPGFLRTATEKLYLDSFLTGEAASRIDELSPLTKAIPEAPRTEGPSASLAGAEPPPPRSAGGEAPRVPEADPVRQAADRFAAEQPDLRLNLGTDADGKPITRSVKEFLAEAREETTRASETAKLFEAAATCLFGGGR